MARPITYDRDEVIQQTTELFWEHGFGHVSIEDVVRVTGMNRHSLYRIFGSKEGLFSAVLDHYGENSRDGLLSGLTDAAGGWSTVERFFRAINAVTEEGPNRTCLMARTLIAPFPDDDERIQKAVEHFEWIEARIQDALEVALGRGELAQDVDPSATARLLTLLLQGATLSRKRAGSQTRLDVAFDAVARGVLALG